MKKWYESPKLELTKYSLRDIITASDPDYLGSTDPETGEFVGPGVGPGESSEGEVEYW